MSEPFKPRFRPLNVQQRGQAALIAVLMLLGMGAAALVYALATPAAITIENDKKTAAALTQAVQALIGRAAADQSIPGSLPCPDTDNDGSAELLVGNDCPSYLGRLPWKTLGLTDLRDGNGERLWYALSPNFRDDSSASPLNSDTPGQFTITGTVPATSVIAIVFAPGRVVGTQNRDTAVTSNCSTTGTNLLNSNCAANYLENENGNGLPLADTTFTTALASDTFNDTLMPITRDALFNVVNIRVAREAITALETYYTANSYYPFANAYGTAAPYNCTSGLNRGRLPITPTGCGQVAWGALPAWFSTNNWNLVTHYAMSKACGQLGLPLGLDPVVAALCASLGNWGPVSATLSALGLTDDPITVTGISSNVRVLVVVSGRASGTQVHTCADAANCMEDAENTNGNAVYVKPTRYPTTNDRLALTCATTAPCSVLP